MEKYKKEAQRLIVLFLTVMLAVGNTAYAFALNGNVTGRKQATVTVGSTNWSFTLQDVEGYEYDGTCVEPSNSIIPEVGEKVSMTKISGSSIVAKIAYLGSKEGTGDKQMYVISRAAARARGEIPYNNYNYLEEVNHLYDAADTMNGEIPDNFFVYIAEPVNGGQTMLAWRTQKLLKGWAAVKKVPLENAHLVKESPQQYTLAGAVYNLYKTEEGARKKSESLKVAVLTTRNDGSSNRAELPVGTYYGREVQRPKGYDWDHTIHKVVVEPNDVTVFTSGEKPLFDPVNILVSKKDASGNSNGPSLAGAEFTVKYYPVITDNISGYTAVRTWKFRTNSAGRILFDESFQIGGDNLFKDENGQPVGLIGTYTVQETKAPKGYVRDNKIYYTHIKETGTERPGTVYQVPEIPNERKEFRLELVKHDSETGKISQGNASLAGAVFGLYRDGKLVKQYTTGSDGAFTTEYHTLGDGSHVYTLRELSAPEGYLQNDTVYTLTELVEENLVVPHTTIERTVQNKVVKGKVSVSKVHDAADCTGTLKPEPGIHFQIYLKTAGSYDEAEDAERDLITTDDDGYAVTKALPYGVYTVHQMNTTEGHGTVEDFDVAIREDGKVYRYTLNNSILKSDLCVKKIDAETGKLIPMANTAFKIWNVTQQKWVSFEMKYPAPQTLDTFLTDSSGGFCLPESLRYGQYELVEQTAPAGYVLEMEPIPFQVDGSMTDITINAKNMPQKGIIEVTKKGELLQSVMKNKDGSYKPVFCEKTLSGAIFEITAAEDIVTPDGTKRYREGELVDTIKTTGTEGKACSKELYLGGYYITEKSAPDNHVLNPKKYKVELVYAGQQTAVTKSSITIENERQKAEVEFLKAMEKDGLYGYGEAGYKNVIFGIFADEDITAEDGSVIPKDGLIQKVGVEPAGSVYKGTFDCDLPHGRFYVKEIETAEGYLLSDCKYEVAFCCRDQTVEKEIFQLNGESAIQNQLIRGSVSGQKINVSGEVLSGAFIGLFKEDETVFTESTALQTDISDMAGRFFFDDVPFGNYIARELKAPKGYALNQKEYPVCIKAEQEVVRVQMINEPTKLHVSKTDIVTGELIAGATLQIIPLNKDGTLAGKPIATWITEEEPYYIEEIPIGNYVLRETMAPDGYVKAQDIRFTVKDNEKIQKVEMKDDYIKVAIAKKDGDTQKMLAGAELQLCDEKGRVVAKWVSKDSVHMIERLPAGKYTLKECTPPKGYTSTEEMTVEVKATAELQFFALENKKQSAPRTNDMNQPLAWLTVVIFGTISLVAGKKQKK